MQKKIKVLVIDDAAFMRKAIIEILESDSDIDVVDSARNGVDALNKIKILQPDVVTLDMDMPVMDGLTAIRHIMIKSPVPIVVLSSLSNDGAITFEALRLGVVDFIPKPSGAISKDIDQRRQEIIDRIKIACSINLENVRRVRLSSRKDGWGCLKNPNESQAIEYLLVIGTTLSGPNTVIRLLSTLSTTIPAAVVVVQEISPKILSAFTDEFNRYVPWEIKAAQNEDVLKTGTCYIGSHTDALSISLNHQGIPSIKIGDPVKNPLNLFFSSAADIFQQNTIGVLLTGIGKDGANGFKKIQKSSGTTIAQETQCCVYPHLTHHAIQKGVVDLVVNEKNIASAIESVIRK